VARGATAVRGTGAFGDTARLMAAPNVEELERQFNVAMEEADTGTTLEAIRRLYGELERDDTEAVEAIAHKQLVVSCSGMFLDGKSYRGVKGFMDWRRDMAALFDKVRFQPVGIRAAGSDRWLVLGRLHATEADEGAEIDLPLVHVLEQRDRKVAAITVYSDISTALESVGIYT
jgi:ketosteroid isomerase-like protein